MDRNFIITLVLLLGASFLFMGIEKSGLAVRGNECSEIDVGYENTVCMQGSIFKAELVNVDGKEYCKWVKYKDHHEEIAKILDELGVQDIKRFYVRCKTWLEPGGKKIAEFVWGPDKSARWLAN